MRLLGPVFWYDLVRVARRQRLALWRALYGLVLLAALFLLYTSMLPHAWLGGARVKPDDAAAFAGYFFAVFVALQFAAVVLLTPALAANALAEEKSHNTLVFLLTTHLTNREIVLGKLFTRLLQVGLLVLTGLPVLGLLQFMGGVDPQLVLASFAALAVTGLSLGSLGLACALFARRPQNAAWRAYQLILAYAALSAVSIWLWDLPFGRGTAWKPVFAGAVPVRGVQVSTYAPPSDPTLFQQALEGFNLANPYFAYLRLYYLQAGGELLEDAWPPVLRDYALAHGAFALLFAGLATLRLRAAAARQVAGLTHRKALVLKAAPHPPIRERPVLWKEVYCEARPRQRWLALFFSRWFFFASFLPAWIFLVLVLDHDFGQLTTWTLVALRYGGTLVAFGLCLRVALHAARSIGQERDRQTLDSLLTTDLTPEEIVRDKGWGSYLSGRWVLLWLLIHWGLGMLAFALHPLALVLLLAECLVFAAFFAGLGMYFAARYPTTRQAATAALVVGLIGTSLLPWAGGKLLTAVLPPEMWMAHRPNVLYYGYVEERPWPDKLAAGLTPARVLFESVVPNVPYFQSFYVYIDNGRQLGELVPWALLGLLVYAAAALVLMRLAAVRFRRAVRTDGRRPPRPRPAARAVPVGP
jgi:ABC-type transport system involved in multi-copper enzyme maturation permease subunit